MRTGRPALFKERHFAAEMIEVCVRWYLRYALSYRDLEELMAERNLRVDHVTIWRRVQRYPPELAKRCRRELRRTNASWRVDETYLPVACKWTYFYRADPKVIAELKKTHEPGRRCLSTPYLINIVVPSRPPSGLHNPSPLGTGTLDSDKSLWNLRFQQQRPA